jgi:hypothetical protein
MPASREVRRINEVPGGYYDEDGFYLLPEGGKTLSYSSQLFFVFSHIFALILITAIKRDA